MGSQTVVLMAIPGFWVDDYESLWCIMSDVDIVEARQQFSPDHCFLNTATVGLGTRDAAEALAADLELWRSGRVDIYSYDEMIHRSRVAFSELVGASDIDGIAIMSQLSSVSGMVAASLSPGDEVLAAEEDFTSLLFPFLARAEDGISTRVVPLDHIIEAIGDRTTLVAVSAVQSADGRVIDLDALADTADSMGAMTFIDSTHGAGWLPMNADRFSVTASTAYKWLCCPRGAGLMTIRPDMLDRFRPNAANWYAGELPWDTNYGPPLRLARSARRFDISPAWSSWAAAAPTLELLAAVGTETIHAHNLGLANAFREGLGLEPSNSAIVSMPIEGAAEALAAADISAAVRAGLTRLSFHLYNTVADVEEAIAALT